MTSPHLAAIRRTLSDFRLDAYRTGPGDSEVDLQARYLWNLALAEALHPSLHCLEIALRNALNNAISATHGSQWYDNQQVLVDAWGRDEVQKAKIRLARKEKPLDPGRIVAELEFGFWTSLLDKRYAQSAVSPTYQFPLWPGLIPVAFPRFTQASGNPSAGRPALSKRFNAIRKQLRNRVSHHEPIWRGWYDRSSGIRTSLDDEYSMILEALAWLSPELRDTVVKMDRFPEVYRAGFAPFRMMLEQLS